MKKSLTLILILIIVLVLVVPIFPVRAGGTRESGSAPGMESIYTDYDGVYLTVKSIDADDGGHKVFNIVWHNDTSQTITYGAKYSIEFKDGVEWKDVSQEDIIFLAIGYLLKPHSTTIESYTTQRFDISKNGIYRLRSDFSNGDGKQYCTWIEFEVGTSVSNVD